MIPENERHFRVDLGTWSRGKVNALVKRIEYGVRDSYS